MQVRTIVACAGSAGHRWSCLSNGGAQVYCRGRLCAADGVQCSVLRPVAAKEARRAEKGFQCQRDLLGGELCPLELEVLALRPNAD